MLVMAVVMSTGDILTDKARDATIVKAVSSKNAIVKARTQVAKFVPRETIVQILQIEYMQVARGNKRVKEVSVEGKERVIIVK